MSADLYDEALAMLRGEWRREALPGESVADWGRRTGRRFVIQGLGVRAAEQALAELDGANGDGAKAARVEESAP